MNEEWSNDYKKKIGVVIPKDLVKKHIVQVVKNDKNKNKIKTSERRNGKKNIRRKNAIIS